MLNSNLTNNLPGAVEGVMGGAGVGAEGGAEGGAVDSVGTVGGALNHSERSHAVLSASGSHRWLNCTPSARLGEQFEDKTSEAAEEGTAAHELCEWTIRTKYLGETLPRPESPYEDQDMRDYAEDYASFVWGLVNSSPSSDDAGAEAVSPGALLLETHVDFSQYVPEGYGTADAIIISGNRLTIVDFKYGINVEVSAYKNSQLGLYALGALELAGSDVYNVEIIIFQPRRHNISSYETTVFDLKEWGETVVRPAALKAYKGEGELKAGQWCAFCKCKSICRERVKITMAPAIRASDVFKTYASHTSPSDTFAPGMYFLTDEEIADTVKNLPKLIKLSEDINTFAIQRVLEGKKYKGLVLKSGRSTRKWSDEDKAAEIGERIMAEMGKEREDIYRLITITDMEKKVGKRQFAEAFGSVVIRTEGNMVLTEEK